MKIKAIYSYNISPVQCSGSSICGAFALYFVIFRYYNLDQEYIDFLNNIFKKDCDQNEEEVNAFMKTFGDNEKR